jgi:TRAP-type transport system periplasmic protein
VRVGAIAFGLISAATISSIVPIVDVGNLGFAFRDEAEALRVMDGPLGAYLRTEIATKGVYPFSTVWNSGMFAIGANPHAIRVPDDLHGLKIRVSDSRITADFFKELGASPTPLPMPQVYSALQTKLIDGEAAPIGTIATSRLFEVNKYISQTNHGWSHIMLLANPDVIKSLPPDIAAIIERNARKYALLERRDTQLLNASVAEKLVRQGVLFNRVDQAPFRNRLGTYYGSWAVTFGPTVWGLLERSVGRKLV